MEEEDKKIEEDQGYMNHPLPTDRKIDLLSQVTDYDQDRQAKKRSKTEEKSTRDNYVEMLSGISSTEVFSR